MGQSVLHDLKARVDARLSVFFADKRQRTASLGDPRASLVNAIASLTERGGKRLRPALLYAAYVSVTARENMDAIVDVGAGLELLQSYLLIHDDWMDGDAERRGGPSVHVMLAGDAADEHAAASLAILAGDLACTYAWELVSGGAAQVGHQQVVLSAFAAMQEEVVLGQELDLRGSDDVERMEDLKTGSYTVRGPMLLGALMGGADDAALAAFERIGRPLGIAFQLRDDLLGTFGDAARTGKPVGGDLRTGKRTAIVAEAMRALSQAEQLELTRVLGHTDASDKDIGSVTSLLTNSGVRSRVETRARALAADAYAALESAPFSSAGKELLGELFARLVERDR